MKNILLLGNGFDLYYKLPTKYDNFLHVVNYLLSNRSRKYETVGDVFSQKTLQDTDRFITQCYRAHQQTFDATCLNQQDVSEIISLTERNLWFAYLNKVLNKDVGWIDFEKEIGFVLKCFQRVFEQSTCVHFKNDEKHVKYVIELFGFYIDKIASKNVVTIGTYKVNADYCMEMPVGSGNNIVNIDKVVGKLYSELLDLAQALKLYLKCFVENAYELLKKDETCERLDFLSHIEKTITFNYTNTYEKLYFNNSAFHIHGNVNDEIILGVNSDEADELKNINTTFVCFKKYFQRTLFETDQNYLCWMKEFVDIQMSYRLFAMGHSLDITDRDIIEELFRSANEIVVLYHNTTAKKSYITNLIKIFGKDGFELLKKEKKLAFISLEQDLTFLKATLSDESWRDLQSMMDDEQGEKIIVV